MKCFTILLLIYCFKQCNLSVISTLKSEISENALNESQDIFIWDKHVEFVNSNLKLCLEDETYSDVVFIAKSDEKRIAAHRIILHAASPYFQNMFTDSKDLIEGDGNEIVIIDIKGDILKLIIEFCYYGKIVITADNVEELLIAADIMKFDMIVNRCTEFLFKKMDKKNCQGISKVLKLYKFTKTSREVNDFININFIDVTKCEGFLTLNIDDVAELLSRENINIDSEDDVFMALKNWVKHDWENRKAHLSKLLELIKLPLLSKQIFWKEAVEWLGWKDAPFDKIFAGVLEVHMTGKKNENIGSPKYVARLGTRRLIILTGIKKLSIKMKNFDGTSKIIGNTTTDEVIDQPVYADKKIFVIKSKQQQYSQLEYFDLIDQKWINLASRLNYLTHCSLAYYMGQIYLLGSGAYSYGSTTYKSINIETKTSYDISPMNTPRRTYTGVEVVGDKIYVIGGYSNNYGSYSNKVEYYEPEKNTWTDCPSLVVARSHVKVVFFDGYLYAIGGSSSSGSSIVVERYKPGESHWKLMASLPTSNCQAACVYRNSLIIVCRTEKNENKWFMYNTSKDSWDPVDISSERYGIRFLFSITGFTV